MNKIKLYLSNLENKFKISVLKKLGWEQGIRVLGTDLWVKEGEYLRIPDPKHMHPGQIQQMYEILGYSHPIEIKVKTTKVANHTVQEAWVKEMSHFKDLFKGIFKIRKAGTSKTFTG